MRENEEAVMEDPLLLLIKQRGRPNDVKSPAVPAVKVASTEQRACFQEAHLTNIGFHGSCGVQRLSKTFAF